MTISLNDIRQKVVNHSFETRTAEVIKETLSPGDCRDLQASLRICSKRSIGSDGHPSPSQPPREDPLSESRYIWRIRRAVLGWRGIGGILHMGLKKEKKIKSLPQLAERSHLQDGGVSHRFTDFIPIK